MITENVAQAGNQCMKSIVVWPIQLQHLELA